MPMVCRTRSTVPMVPSLKEINLRKYLSLEFVAEKLHYPRREIEIMYFMKEKR